MTVSDSRPSGLVPVHVGQSTSAELRIEWHKHGVEPRGIGMETSDCAAAFDPSTLHSRGADELQRFLEGARSRQETALVVATIGDVMDDSPRSVLSRYDASVSLPDFRQGSISGRRLPTGSRPALASDLSPADRDLGLRLLNRPPDAPWWMLTLHGLTLEPGAGGPPITVAPQGRLHPVLVDGLRNPVVAVWTPPAGDQRWYIIPDATDWNGLVDWLVYQALPTYVPDALRRARAPHFIDPELQTQAELIARQALADITTRYIEERKRLEAELQRAQAAAEGVRYGLLYGTGKELVDAVDAVLKDGGFTTVNLDEELRQTRSADLLVTFQQQRRLMEIKSASGNAAETLVTDLQRHLATWHELRPQEPVDGGVLIVNHQYRLGPHQRSPQVYSRPEFIAALTVPVIGTRTLFEWWRVSDWVSIREAVLGPMHPTDGVAALPPDASRASRPAPPTPGSQKRQWPLWQRKHAD